MIKRVYSYFTGGSYHVSNDGAIITALICGLMLGVPAGFLIKVLLDTLTFYEYLP